MITKVKLVNWRSHLNSELEFTNGTNALLGHIGSGKSSVLDSICFAFFGTFPALQSKKLKLDEIIMNKPDKKDRSEVEVSFSIDGNKYSVRRVVEKGKGTTYSELRENGKLLEAPSTQRVNELVEKVLKVNYELFNKAIYSEQNSLDYFLTIQKGQRMKSIDELLLISKFERARSNAVSLVNKLMDRKLGKQSVIDRTNSVQLEKSIEELTVTLNRISVDKNTLEKNLESTIQEKNRLGIESVKLKIMVENLRTLGNEEASITSVFEEISMAIKALGKNIDILEPQNIEKELKNLNRLSQEFEEVLYDKQRHYSKIQDQTSKAKAEIEVIKQEKIERLQSEITDQMRIKKDFEEMKKMLGEDIEKSLDEKRLELEKYVGEAEALKMKIKEAQEALEHLSSLGAKCPICEHRLTEEKKIILTKQKKVQTENLLDALTKVVKKRERSSKELKELEAAAKKIEVLSVQIKDLDGLKKDLESYKNILVVQNESYTELGKELKQLEIETKDIQKKFNEMMNRKQEMEILHIRAKEFVEKSKRLDILMNQRRMITQKTEELENNLEGKDVEKFENHLRLITADERELRTKISSMNELFKEKQERLSEFEKTLSVINKEKSEVQRLYKLIKDLQIFGIALEQTQIELRREFIATVNYAMGNIWQTLYPYKDFSNIRLSVEEGDYILQLQSRNGEWTNVEGFASGGERSLAALALRIAFSLVLAPQLRMLILDEPTANLDARAISELSTTLRERIGDFVNQAFLITHTSELENAVNGVAYRLERDKSTDSPTKVIQLN